jgi:hypothetical protein
MRLSVDSQIEADGEMSSHFVMSDILGRVEKREWKLASFFEVL